MLCHSLAHSHSVSLSPPPTPLTFVPLLPLHLCSYLIISLSPSTTSVSFPFSLPFTFLLTYLSFFPATTYFCFFSSLSSLHLYLSSSPPLLFLSLLFYVSPLLCSHTLSIIQVGDEVLPRAQGEWEYWRGQGSDAVPLPSKGTAWASGLAFLF